MVRREHKKMDAIGLNIKGSWMLQLLTGITAGLGICLLAVLLENMVFGMQLAMNNNFGWTAFLIMVHFHVWAVLWQEVVYRGYIFQKLLHKWGIWPTQLLIALFFSLMHFSQGTPMLVTTFFCSFLFGFGYISTRSLAMPIGLHLGLNIMVRSFTNTADAHSLFTRSFIDSAAEVPSIWVMILPTLLIVSLGSAVLYVLMRRRKVSFG